MASFQVVTWNTAKGANKRVDSSAEAFDFQTVRIGADQLAIAQVGSGAAAAFDFGNRKLSNIGDPTSAQDAATKNFVEELFQTADGASNQALADSEARVTSAYQAADQQIATNAQNALDAAVSSLHDAITDGDNAAVAQAQQALDAATASLTSAYEAADQAVQQAAQQAVSDAQTAITTAYGAADAATLAQAQQALTDAINQLTSDYQSADQQVASNAENSIQNTALAITSAYEAADQSIAATAQQALDAANSITTDYQAADQELRSYVDQRSADDQQAINNSLQELRSDYQDGDANTLAHSKEYTDSQIAGIPSVDTTPFLKKDGSVAATGDFDLGSHRVKNVSDPTAAQDATTKNYVDVANAALQNAINAFAMKLSWRPQVRAASGDTNLANAADGTALSTLLPLSDDDAPAMTLSDFFAGDFIFSKNGASSKMFVVIDDGGTLKVTTQNVKPLAEGDTFLVLNDLPDSPAAQEGAAIYAFGTDVVKVGDMDWSLATGIDLSPSFAAVAGTITAGESVEGAISKLVANLAAEATIREQYDTAIQAAIVSAQANATNDANNFTTTRVNQAIAQEVSDRNAAIQTASTAANAYADNAAETAKFQAQNYAQTYVNDHLVKTDEQGLHLDNNNLSLVLDGQTLTKGTNGLKVKAAGITQSELAASVAGSGLTGGAGQALSVKTGDGVQLDANGNVATDYTISATNPTSVTLTKGQVVSLGANGVVALAIATDSNLPDSRIGVVAADAAAGAAMKINIRTNAIITVSSTLIVGKKVFVARDVAGNITQDLGNFQTGDQVERVGYAIGANAYVLDAMHEIEL
jgi:hypothetical protein